MEDLSADELGFRFQSGRVCLDLAVTVGERWRRSFERLREPSDLGRWLTEARLLQEQPPVSPGHLRAARELREAVYRTARLAGSRRPDPSDVDEINRWAVKAPLAPRLAADGRTVSWTAARPVEAALSTIARDAIDLFSGPFATRVRECARPDCGLLFVDTSRPGRRRWCSMEACGNRTKTAAYRARHKAKAGPDA
jgi:predicted RNA-binding Zn ribbon-like protein